MHLRGAALQHHIGFTRFLFLHHLCLMSQQRKTPGRSGAKPPLDLLCREQPGMLPHPSNCPTAHGPLKNHFGAGGFLPAQQAQPAAAKPPPLAHKTYAVKVQQTSFFLRENKSQIRRPTISWPIPTPAASPNKSEIVKSCYLVFHHGGGIAELCRVVFIIPCHHRYHRPIRHISKGYNLGQDKRILG